MVVVESSSCVFFYFRPFSRSLRCPLTTFPHLIWWLILVLEDTHIKTHNAIVLVEVSYAGKDSFGSAREWAGRYVLNCELVGTSPLLRSFCHHNLWISSSLLSIQQHLSHQRTCDSSSEHGSRACQRCCCEGWLLNDGTEVSLSCCHLY